MLLSKEPFPKGNKGIFHAFLSLFKAQKLGNSLAFVLLNGAQFYALQFGRS
jgi:hypothetical protein